MLVKGLIFGYTCHFCDDAAFSTKQNTLSILMCLEIKDKITEH